MDLGAERQSTACWCRPSENLTLVGMSAFGGRTEGISAWVLPCTVSLPTASTAHVRYSGCLRSAVVDGD